MLRIVGRRPNGYHELQTVFQFVDFCDFLYFQPRIDRQIRLSPGFADIDDADNLIIRAANLLNHYTQNQNGADIRVEKNIPMGGGLGGGSSNAATTLLALNKIWQTGLGPQELARLGASLGADVPIFIHGHAAWAEGMGEKFTPIELPEPYYLIIKPDCEVSTAQIFNDCGLTRDADRITIRDFLSGDDGNDCQAVVELHHPPVKLALDWLAEFADAKLTGTGACVFAAFDSKDSADTVHNKLPRQWTGWVCQGLNQSPVLDKL